VLAGRCAAPHGPRAAASAALLRPRVPHPHRRERTRLAAGASVFTALANHYRLDPAVTKRDVAALFRHAIALRRVAPGSRPEDVASALSALGVLLVQEERWAEAEATLGEALALRRARATTCALPASA